MSVTVRILNNTNPEAKELNMANGNFVELWRCLGLQPETEFGLAGWMDGRTLVEQLSKCRSSDVVKADESEGNFHSCGRSLTQVERYLTTLLSIGLEAQRQENQVTWS